MAGASTLRDTTAGAADIAAVLVIDGRSINIVSATPRALVLRAGSLGSPVLPAPCRVVFSSPEGGVTIPLTALMQMRGPRDGEITLVLSAADPVLWDSALAAAAGGHALDPRIAIALAMPNPAENAARSSQRRRRAYLCIAACIGLSAAVIGTQVYKTGYKASAASSFVAVDFQRLGAPASGRVVFLPGKTQVAAGEPVIGVTQRSGHDISIESPCDCTVVGLPAPVGTTVTLGDPLVLLARRDARAFVVAGVSRDLLFRLGHGATVRLAYGDGVVVSRSLGPIHLVGQLEALIASLMPPEDPAATATAPERAVAETPLVYIRLDPGRELTSRSIATPVSVSFDLFWGSGFSGVVAGQQGALNHAG